MTHMPSRDGYYPVYPFQPVSSTPGMDQWDGHTIMQQQPWPQEANGFSWEHHDFVDALPTIAGQGGDPSMADHTGYSTQVGAFPGWPASTGTQHTLQSMQHGPMGGQYIPQGMQYRPTGMQYMPQGMQYGPTGMQYIPQGVQHGPSGTFISTANQSTRYGHSGTLVSPAGQSTQVVRWDTSTVMHNPATQATQAGPLGMTRYSGQSRRQSMQVGPSSNQRLGRTIYQRRRFLATNRSPARLSQTQTRAAQKRYRAGKVSTQRRSPGRAVRLQEYGNRLLQAVERTQGTFVLQITPPRGDRWAVCAALESCISKAEASWTNKGKQPSDFRRQDIADPYRIMLDVGNDKEQRAYFHHVCFQHMFDAPSLVPVRFKMEGMSAPWGLMVNEWFKHRGCINLGKVAEYIEAEKAYHEDLLRSPREYWMLRSWCTHLMGEHCDCLGRPELKDHITGSREACSLCDVLNHPLGGKKEQPMDLSRASGGLSEVLESNAMTTDQMAIQTWEGLVGFETGHSWMMPQW